MIVDAAERAAKKVIDQAEEEARRDLEEAHARAPTGSFPSASRGAATGPRSSTPRPSW